VSDEAGIGRPPAFSYRRVGGSQVLHCDRVSLLRLAEDHGTPLYVYSARAIRQRVRQFEAAFRGVPHTLCYSVKANSNLSILRLLSKLGCGFDVVSGGELQRVLRANRAAAENVVFSGVGKTTQDMETALHAGILLFNVESESELRALARCAARLKRDAPIALRVNPEVPAKTHPYISTGLQQHKFGIPIREARRLYAAAATMPRLKVRGVSVHIGSQIADPKPFAIAISRVSDLVRDLRRDGHQIQYVDAGGGLGIAYEPCHVINFSSHVRNYARAILKPLRGFEVHLLLEPGRSIVGPAGALLTRALYRKNNNRKRFLVVDAAMNDLLRPSLYNAYHEIVPVRQTATGEARAETVDVVGPICETGDFLARNRKLPRIEEGELLAIVDAGAYGLALASNYNTRCRPAEVLVEGTSAKVIRRREAIADVLRLEKL
jgi:diaminopimelate decarboxylase